MNGKYDPTPPGTDCVVARPTICSTPAVGAVNAARRASLNQPPHPVLGELESVERLLWEGQGVRPAVDACGELDFSHIDSFEWEEGR